MLVLLIFRLKAIFKILKILIEYTMATKKQSLKADGGNGILNVYQNRQFLDENYGK